MAADLKDRLRRTPVTGAMAVCFSSLLLGAPFAFAWLSDDGGGNQPFPRGLRLLVVAAAAVHVGVVAGRLAGAAWAREPVSPVARRMAAGYILLAVAAALGWELHNHGLIAIASAAMAVPTLWGLCLLAQALNPEALRRERAEKGPLP